MRSDDRLDTIETVTVQFETFKKALTRNFLGGSDRHDRSYVLRLYPPFEAEMEAEYYESEQGRHYNNEWAEKPFHLAPEIFILEGSDTGFRGIIDWPTEASVRNALSDEEIAAEGGIESALAVSREMFWEELRSILPETVDMAHFAPHTKSYPVEVDWQFSDGE